MTEYYECSQENLRCKTAELDDARNIIDSMQEKIIYVENELASHKNGDIDHSETQSLLVFSNIYVTFAIFFSSNLQIKREIPYSRKLMINDSK